jgi:hypothetical protein
MLVVAAFLWFMRRTRWGKAIDVVAFNPETAQLLGINTRAVKISVFVMASLLAAVAGVLIGPVVTLQPHMGLVFTIKALIVAAVGGFANPLGILLGASSSGSPRASPTTSIHSSATCIRCWSHWPSSRSAPPACSARGRRMSAELSRDAGDQAPRLRYLIGAVALLSLPGCP